MSIKTSQAILKCFIDLKSSVFQKQQTQLRDFSRRFSAEAVMTSNVACHAMLWVGKKVTNIQRLETNKNMI